jgi:hypothetical protein
VPAPQASKQLLHAVDSFLKGFTIYLNVRQNPDFQQTACPKYFTKRFFDIFFPSTFSWLRENLFVFQARFMFSDVTELNQPDRNLL